MCSLEQNILTSLFSSGSAPGILYGLPKIHKPDFASKFQFRPIFAAYNNPCFKLAKFLVPILQPYASNDHTVENSASFVSQLEQFNNTDSLFMSSFDISNLYTNIPIHETINILLNLIYSNGVISFLGLSRNLFKNLLELASCNSFFVFNDVLYKQTDGLGMGLPLSGCLSNIFLCFNESIWLSNCPINFKPVFYKRYLDDTFILFHHPSHAPLFLQYMNNQHPNITFTMENEHNRKLPFLDVLVDRGDNKFNTSVYRKPTFSGQGLSFFSHCSVKFKINCIKALLHRAYNICSTYMSLDREFNFLKQYFHNNGYSKDIVERSISKFLNSKFNPLDKQQNDLTNLFFVFPYFGKQSEKLKSDILKLFNKYFTNHQFHIILTNNFTIGSLFNYKDRLNKGMTASAIYKWSCPNCRAHYIGSSSRNLYVRAAEHAGLSYRTGQPLSSPPQSSIRDHAVICNSIQYINSDHFQIIGTSKNTTELRILESIFIKRENPPLNNTFSAFPLRIT